MHDIPPGTKLIELPLVGMTFTSVIHKGDEGDEEIHFISPSVTWKMYHNNDCCESVYIKDISGDLDDLVGSPILFAYENSSFNADGDGEETWTFYRIGTIKGTVTISWYGSSNGYYSTSVDLIETKNDEEEP